MNARTIRRIGRTWSSYQNFLDTQTIENVSLRKLMEKAPDKKVRMNILQAVCGDPPFKDINCGLLAWEIDKGRW